MRPLHKLLLCLFALLILSGTAATAAKIASTARIVDKVDDNQLVTLRGNTHPAANAQNDVGRVSPNLKMTDLILVLSRSPEQQAAFDAFVASQYDSTSPNFHHWLEPVEIGAKFGPSSADIATVSTWLAGRGFSVDEVSPDRMTIRFSGNASQVESAFHTEVHNLSVKGEAHIGNMADPQIPMALEPVVVGVKSLHNFFPRPLHHLGAKAQLNSETGKWERIGGVPGAIKDIHVNGFALSPDFTIGSGTNAIEDVTPYDFAAIYNVLPLWNASTAIDGTGQTIAIAGTSKIRTTDIASFRSIFGLPSGAPALTQTVATGTADPGICTATTGSCTLDDQYENALDVEWSGAVAKNAHIVLVVSGANSTTTDTVYASSNYVVQNNVAKVLNVSYGECELGLGTAGNLLYKNLWQSASAAGIAVFVATGDSGAPACDQGQATSTPYGAVYGLSVSGLASTQYNVAVGGTDLNWGTAATYWNASNSASNGSSAKGYMPEIPWNDSCTNPVVVSSINTQLSKSYTATQICELIGTQQITSTSNEAGLLALVNTSGAGGGKSNCINGDQSTVASCTQGYTKPAFQSTSLTGMPNDSARDIPDVSFFASNGFLGSAYLVCVSDAGACVTSTTITTEPTAQEVGGTSASSPAMAGVMALINQKAGAPQGNPNSQLYTLAGQQTYSSCKSETGTAGGSCYFNDVVTGTIAMPCAGGTSPSPNCTLATTGDSFGVLSGFGATVGYDLATGLGTMNVANVVNAWTAATGSGTATVAVTALPTTITNVQSSNVTVTVTGSSGTPTGTIVIKSGSFASATKSLASGTVSFSIAGSSLAAGTDTLTATYSGDTNYAPTTGTTTLTVVIPTIALSATSPSAINAGGAATSTITVSSPNGYAGTVTLSCALTSSPSGAVEKPTCAPTTGASTVTLTAIATSGNGTVTVSTTPAPAVAHVVHLAENGWFKAAGGVAIASFLFFFVPGRKLRTKALLSLVLLAMAGTLVAIGCGGGGTKTPVKTTPTISVTPAKASITETDPLAVAIVVSGSGVAATGSVTLKSGNYISSSTSLSGSGATITIPASSLSVGASDTLTVTYGGDSNYNSASGTATVTVNKSATTSGAYTFTVTGTGNDAATTTATTTFTVNVN